MEPKRITAVQLLQTGCGRDVTSTVSAIHVRISRIKTYIESDSALHWRKKPRVFILPRSGVWECLTIANIFLETELTLSMHAWNIGIYKKYSSLFPYYDLQLCWLLLDDWARGTEFIVHFIRQHTGPMHYIIYTEKKQTSQTYKQKWFNQTYHGRFRTKWAGLRSCSFIRLTFSILYWNVASARQGSGSHKTIINKNDVCKYNVHLKYDLSVCSVS